MTEQPQEPNVISLKGAKKRLDAKARAGASKAPAKSGKTPGGITIWTWVQFIVFLFVVGYMMQLCQSH